MSRCCFLSSCSDPFLTLLSLKLFQEKYYDEVDKFYININNHASVPQDVIGETLKRLSQDKKVHIVYHPEGIGNSDTISELAKISKEDLVMFLEEDFYIFQSGIVDSYFKKIESGECDLLGSPRYTHGEVADVAQKKYNLDYSGVGDRGFAWWPSFFFCKREDLLKTDMDFGSKKYNKGEYFKELDHTFIEDAHTDTFAWTSIQMRHMGLRSIYIPQHHASPTEAEDKRARTVNWINGNSPPYIHAGSLSSGWGGYLSGQLPDVSTDGAKQEIETRVAWWSIAENAICGFDSFRTEYEKGLDNLVIGANLDMDRIQAKYDLYRNLLKIT